MLSSPRVFRNFYARLAPEADNRRRRLEKALRLSSPGLLELVLNDFENRVLSALSDAQREAYFAGNLNSPDFVSRSIPRR